MNKNRPTLLLFRLITGALAVREQKHYDGEIPPYTLGLCVKEVGFLKDATITDEESSPMTKIKATKSSDYLLYLTLKCSSVCLFQIISVRVCNRIQLVKVSNILS